MLWLLKPVLLPARAASAHAAELGDCTSPALTAASLVITALTDSSPGDEKPLKPNQTKKHFWMHFSNISRSVLQRNSHYLGLKALLASIFLCAFTITDLPVLPTKDRPTS